MADHTCFECGGPADHRAYRRVGHRMQVMVLCEACTGRVASDMTQQMSRWLEQERTVTLIPAHSPTCVSPEDAARRMGVSRRVVYRLVESGQLSVIRIKGNPSAKRAIISIPLSELERYIAEGGAA